MTDLRQPTKGGRPTQPEEMTMRTTAQIQDEIMTLAHGADYPYAELGKLWREMARAASRENQPGWAQLAAALLADDYDRRARV